MSTTATLDPREASVPSAFAERLKGDPAYQAFLLLRIAFTVAPILFGLDKFFDVMVDWEIYLAPWINDIVPGSAATAMHLVGIVEIVAGLVRRPQAPLRRLRRRRLARRHHRQPPHLLGLLRRRAAGLRPDARRPDPGSPGEQVRPAGLGGAPLGPLARAQEEGRRLHGEGRRRREAEGDGGRPARAGRSRG